jgi:phosphinothricin acetyltransferase
MIFKQLSLGNLLKKLSKINIDIMRDEDWSRIRTIYEEGIATKNATFETEVPEWDEWDKEHLKTCRIVARNGQNVSGWAALSPVSSRCIYSGVAEVSVYVSSQYRGNGIGKLLLRKLIENSENSDIWTLQAGIFPENQSSIELHKKLGFREVGYREKIGKLDGIWRNVILLERRSKNIL